VGSLCERWEDDVRRRSLDDPLDDVLLAAVIAWLMRWWRQREDPTVAAADLRATELVRHHLALQPGSQMT
jgi:hypothetical protein